MLIFSEPVPIVAYLGSANMSDLGDTVSVAEMRIHIDYDAEAWQNDIVLLRLQRATFPSGMLILSF